MAQRGRFVAFFALGSFACGSPASTSDANTGVTSYSFDFQPTQGPVDGQCMPDVIGPQADCSVSCVALVVYRDQTDQAAGCTDPGTSQPDPQTLSRFAARYPQEPAPVVCVYRQLVGGASSSIAKANTCTNATPDYTGTSCEGGDQAGWCYAEGAAITGGCPVAIQFGASGPTPGAWLHFDCME